jgi:hypothetical protein
MKMFGLVAQLRSSITAAVEGAFAQVRVNRLGELIIKAGTQEQLALEGAYFIGTNPTIGTAVALQIAAATTFVATAPNITVRNTDVAGGKDIILKRLTLLYVTAGTGITSVDMAVVVDNTNRITSGGTAITPNNVKVDSPNTTIASMLIAGASAIVAAAAGAGTRLVGRAKLFVGAVAVGQVYKISFGSDLNAGSISNGNALTGAQDFAPIVIPPGCMALIYLFNAGATVAPTYEFMLEWTER